MPGIVGFITKNPRPDAKAELARMVEAIRHESSYSTGTWIDEPNGVYVGWAVRKNSFGDGMPFQNERRDVALFFSGEDFPETGTIDRLKSAGHDAKSGGASYLVHVYEDDPKFPVGLNGQFHGLVVDGPRQTVKLFNDRYGMHRIYYHESKDAFYFSGEAKAILKVRPELRAIDPRGLGEYVACGCVLENRTLFSGINSLPPGSAWLFRGGRLEQKSSYFAPAEWESQEPLSAEAYYEKLREVFSRNLPRYFNGREQVGISLTGGLDTRMIMAWSKAEPNSLPSYTFGGPYRDCQDVVIARRVAEICGLKHQVIPVGSEFLSRFPHFAERTVYLSDGCAPVGRAADLYANEIVAGIAPVRMTGNYGSEILRRLRSFKPGTPMPGLYRQDFLNNVEAAKETYNQNFQGHAVSFTAFRQAPWAQYGLLSLETTQLTLRSPFLDNDVVQTAFRAPNSAIGKSDIFEDNEDCARLIADGNHALRELRTDRGLGGPPGKWWTGFVRSYLEFTFRAEYAYDYGMPQWLARMDHAVSPLHLERLFLGRHKFCHYRVWYRDALPKYLREMLLDPRTLSRPYLEKSGVERIVEGHLRGGRNYTSEIHKVLTLELLHRTLIDSN